MSDIKPIEKEAAQLIETFKEDMKRACEEVLGKVYVDLIPHIETDAWMNFRNDVRREVQGEMIKDVLSNEYGYYSFGWMTRKKILEEHKDELILAINTDHIAEIQRLKEEIKRSYERYK